jgi:transposase
MIIIGVDYHPSVQQIAYVDTETGETCERRLNHSDGEAEHFMESFHLADMNVQSPETPRRFSLRLDI